MKQQMVVNPALAPPTSPERVAMNAAMKMPMTAAQPKAKKARKAEKDLSVMDWFCGTSHDANEEAEADDDDDEVPARGSSRDDENPFSASWASFPEFFQD